MKSNIDQAYNRIIGNQIHVAMSKKICHWKICREYVQFLSQH